MLELGRGLHQSTQLMQPIDHFDLLVRFEPAHRV
jgi:hypothetical protein